jgi:mannose-6-phosphate isomerase-like protein (cupin superfamily)
MLFAMNLAYSKVKINLPAFANLSVHSRGFAADGSQWRPLVKTSRGSMSHFTLLPGATSLAMHQKVVQEIWYFLSGDGQVWLKYKGRSKVYNVHRGSAVALPNNVSFQFRNLSKTKPLTFVEVTIPAWPGNQIISKTKGIWQAKDEDK